MEEAPGSAEVEKPFKCSVCSSRFTNEDHLQVHKRRHEMSLNLNKNATLTLGHEGFADETPTPSRFIRNCEEVGLFQDLNPFDEQFSKAASGTPTSENNFGFQFSTNKAPVDPDDTLNTPQVYGYSATTTTSAPMRFVLATAAVSKERALEKNEIFPDDPSEVVDLESSESEGENRSEESISSESRMRERPRPTDNSVESDDAVELGDIPTLISDRNNITTIIHDKKSKSKKLRLDVKILSSKFSSSPPEETVHSPSVDEIRYKRPEKESDERKSEMLERNRAAASRSRQRRKQWVSYLEEKCEDLQSDLERVCTELEKMKNENKLLKMELGRHVNCTLSPIKTLTPSPSPLSLPSSPVVPSLVIRSKPAILRQVSQSSTSAVQQAHGSSSIQCIPSPVINTVRKVNILQASEHPKQPVKRGRPRKGCEKRVAVVQDIPISKNTEPVKVQILPLFSVNKTNNSPQKVYILKS